jgi:PTH1 family peptidyl-tRNA hydrolase
VYLFVGLGNPGECYALTRHNLGFLVVGHLAGNLGVRLVKGPGPYLMAQTSVGREPVLLAKPLTFMNRSGTAVFDLVMRFHIDTARLVLVSDDLNLPLGRLRLRPGGSDGGHNGLASVIRFIRSEAFPRLRLGIGMKGEDAVKYVLSPFAAVEQPIVEDMIERGVSALAAIAQNGLEQAMNLANS